MTMNITEALYVSALTRWLCGDPDVPTEDAYRAAAQLTTRACAVLGTGVTAAQVDTAAVAAASPFARTRALAALLAACWEVDAGPGMGWNGSAVIDAVGNALEAAGFNLTHPAEREDATGRIPMSRREDWDLEALTDYALEDGRTFDPPAADHEQLTTTTKET